MEKKYLLLTFLAMFMFSLPGLTRADGGRAFDELTTLIETALSQNPALLAILDQQEGAGHKVDSADDLADPVVSFAFSNYPVDSFESDATPMTGNELRLAQKLPYPGKLGSKQQVVAQDVTWFRGLYEDARLELTRKVKEGYYKLYAVDRAIDTVKNNLVLLDDLSRLAETRYRVGEGRQSDVLKVHLERTSQRDRLIQLERKRVTLQGTLNSLASQPVNTAITTPAKIDILSLDVSVELETLQTEAVDNRPLITAWEARIDKAKLQRELSRLDYMPDLTLWASYRFRDDNLPDNGTDFASVGFSFNLPLNRSRRAAAVSNSESAVNQARNQFADFRSKVEFAIDDSFHAARHSFELVELYRTGMVPQARQVYAAALSAYQVGKAGFPELLSALLARDKYETELHRLVSEYLQSVARLEAASGVPINVTGQEG
jgi:outer membrane protein TolC